MLPCVPHLINIAQLGKEGREGFGGQVRLCLPRKARSLARSQLSAAGAKWRALSAGGAGRPHSSTGSPVEAALPRNRTISERAGGGLSGRGGGQCPFCEASRLRPCTVPQVGTAPGSRRACRGACQELRAAAKATQSRPAQLCCPPPPPPCRILLLRFKNSIFFQVCLAYLKIEDTANPNPTLISE